jgi:hypothetical protein
MCSLSTYLSLYPTFGLRALLDKDEDSETKTQFRDTADLIAESFSTLRLFNDEREVVETYCQMLTTLHGKMSGAVAKAQARVKKSDWEQCKLDSVGPRGVFHVRMISVQKLCLQYNYGPDKEQKLMGDIQRTLANVASVAPLEGACEMLAIYRSLDAAAQLIISMVSKLNETTKDDTKSFPLSKYDSYSFDDIVEFAMQLSHLFIEHKPDKLKLFPAQAGAALTEVKVTATRVGSRLQSKVDRELNPATMSRTTLCRVNWLDLRYFTSDVLK